jgi:uncharacterized protein YbbC (DUF1343 family)
MKHRFAATAAALVLAAASIAHAQVLTGIDVLQRDGFAPIKGQRVALITNHTAVDRNGKHLLDILVEAKDAGVTVTKIFSPEHGLYGALDEKVKDAVEPKTGLKVFSLYGATRRPSEEMLKDIDVLLFDIQDVGVYYYTYESTMAICMEEAAKHKLKFVVLDRPNPITGSRVGGPVADAKYKGTFTAYGPHALMHGLTMGELAGYFNKEYGINADLTVVPCEGWKRDQWYDATGLLWVNPSPNMRNLTQATLYPAIGILEATNLSVGRGTDQPFELFGAPWVDGIRLAKALNDAKIDGLRFVPVEFTPDTREFKGQKCKGVYIIVTDRDELEPVEAGLEIAWHLKKLFGDQFKIEKVNNLLHADATQKALETAKDPDDISDVWEKDLDGFKKKRKQYLLYR